MRVSIRHIGLITGILSVLTSFLFVGRHQGTYQLMLLAGILISVICFLWILLGGRGKIRSKLLWTGVVILGMVLNSLTETYFINTSYRIYLYQFKKELAETNEILQTQPGDIWLFRDSIREKNRVTLKQADKRALLQNREKLGVYMILKTDSTIYYGLWGFLDVRLGLTYSINGG